jgi:hypothetical protein
LIWLAVKVAVLVLLLTVGLPVLLLVALVIFSGRSR